MEKGPVAEASIYPSNVKTFCVPNDSALKRAYDVYKPSAETIKLLSERDRTVYAELFIENKNLGTLKDLCTAVLARSFGPNPFLIVAENPLLLHVHYEALDVELPLEECYHITAERYWRRVVLAKHKDKTLAVKPNINWKSLGVTLKFVELVEKTPVEYWPEPEIKQLALNIKEFVKEMHIQRLQSLEDRYFQKYFQTDSEESTAEEASSLEDETESSLSSSVKEEILEANDEEAEKSESQLRLEIELENKKLQRKKERQELRKAKRKSREDKEEKRKRHEAKRLAIENPEKKLPKKIPDDIFDIKVSASEDGGEDHIVDKRDKALLLRHIKKYNYPAQDCHHIDLKFVQYFSNLVVFSIEFWGPLQNRYFHKRHQQFSPDDIKNLAIGLSHLSNLKTFRLRNSCMDAEKVQILCRALGLLPRLETLDLGFDQIKDDCGSVFEELLKVTETLKSLELESNYLGEHSLERTGRALKNYNATELLYLGLARNPLTDTALHALVSQIVGTKHVQHLNITGAKFLTERGLCCCLANELLRKHPTLITLDICAIRISPLAADEIVKSLAQNQKVLEIHCSNCGLDWETEVDIDVILRRNKYIAEHYYLGDPTVTKEEITEWLNRTRNPILLKVLAERETHKKCLENRSEESEHMSYLTSPAASHQASVDIKSQMYERHPSEYPSLEIHLPGGTSQQLIYRANDFDEEEFLKHVQQPGPQDRYFYFKTYKQKYKIKDDIKNKSLI